MHLKLIIKKNQLDNPDNKNLANEMLTERRQTIETQNKKAQEEAKIQREQTAQKTFCIFTTGRFTIFI